jgi:hypothetical protein
MKSACPHVLLAVAALAFAGCSSKDAAQADSAATATTVTAAPSDVGSAEPTANEISNYKLDMDRMNRYSAAIKGLGALAQTDSSAVEAMSSDGSETMSQMIAKIEAMPKAMKVLNKAGLDPKDYVWITTAWLQAAMTQGMLEANPKAKVPEGQNLQNVEFLKAHKAELDAMQKSMESGSSDNG